MGIKILTTEELLDKEKKEKEQLGSGFGGGWGLSDLVQEKKEETQTKEPIKLDLSKYKGIPDNVTPAQGKPLDTEEIIQLEEQALVKAEETFSTLDKSIETNYKRYQELGTQLDDLETELQEAPEELKWNLSVKYENLRTEHNKLVDQLKTETEQQKKVYADYNLIRDSYEKDIERYNKKVEAQNKLAQEQHQDYLDTSRLQGSMKPGEELPKTHEEKLKEKFTSTDDISYWGGVAQDPTRLAESKFGTLIKAVGTRRAIEQTFPEEVKHIGELKEDIYKSIGIKDAPKLATPMAWEGSDDAIAEIQSRITGKEVADIKDEIKELRQQGTKYSYLDEYKEAVNVYKYIHSMDRPGLENDFIDALHTMSWAGLMMITGGQVLSTAWGIAPDLVDSVMTKNKVLSRDELWDIVERATGAARDPKADKIFSDIIQDLEARGLRPADALAGKVDVSMRVPRFAFDTAKLYTGLPADEIVKAIVETGKVTADVVKGLDPVQVSQVTQQLLNTAPALASEFLKAVEKPEVKVPETVYHGGAGVKELQQEFKVLTPEEKQSLPSSHVGLTGLSMTPNKERELPDITIPQRQEIEAKVDEVIAQEIPKIQAKFPEMTIPQIKEQIMPKVAEEVKKIVPKAEGKMPEVPKVLTENARKYNNIEDFKTAFIRESIKGDKVNISTMGYPKYVDRAKSDFEIEIDKYIYEGNRAFDLLSKDFEMYIGKGKNKKIIETAEEFKVANPKYKEYSDQEIKELVNTYYDKASNLIEKKWEDIYNQAKTPPKPPEITIPQKEILAKVEQVVKEELPKLKYEAKKPEMAIPEKEVVSTDTPAPKPVEAEAQPDWFKPDKATVDEVAKAPDPVQRIRAIKEETQKSITPKPKHKSIKTQIREVTGQTPPSKIELRERDILKYVLRGEQRVARDIFNKGKEEGIFQANEKFENRLQRIQERKDIKELRQEIREQEKQDKIAALKKSNTPSNIVDKKSDALIYSGQKNNDNPITIQENKILGYILKGEERAARQAFRAGKEEGIFQQKEHFEDVVARAKERKAKSQEINKIKDIVRNTNLKELRPERKANIEKIIEDLDLSKMTGRTQAKLTSRLDYVRENPDNQIPIERLDELARLNKKPIADLTADEIRNIKDAILHEIHLNKLKNKLEFGREIKDANEVLKTARKNVLKGGKGLKNDPGAIIDSGETEHRSLWQKLKNFWGIDSLNTEVICEELDHGDHGEIMKYVYTGIDKGVTDKLKVMQDADDWFTKELEGIDIAKWSKSFQQKKSSIDFQTIKLKGGTSLDGKQLPDKKIKITKGERVSFLLHNQNNKNLAHLTGGGFRFSDKPSAKYRLTEENIKQIVDSATPEEKKVAKAISKFFNEYMKPKINDASMKLNGFEVATEDNYFPIRTLELDRQRDALKAKRTFHHKTLEGMGIFKDRTNATNALIIEDAFNVVVKHLEQTSSYIGLAKPLRYARFIVEDTELQENVMKNHGKEYLDNLKNYLNIIEDESTNVENFDKLTSELINKLDPAVLGLHIFIGFKQPVSYIAASTQIETKYLDKGFSIKTNVAEIKKYSPQLRQRFEGHVTRELGELGSVGKTRQFFLHKSPVNAKYLKGIMYMDGLTIGKIWNAVKLEISDKYPDLTGEEYMQKVTERAEEVIRRTQPTWHPKDRSYIGRSRSMWLRLATKYSSQRNKNWIIVKRAILRYNRSGKTNKDKIRLASDVGKVYVVMAALIAAIDAVRDKVYGRKGKGILGFAIDTLLTALGTFYIVGDLASSMISKIQRGTYAGFDSMGNIVASWVDGGINGIAELVRGISQLEEKEKYKSGTKKGEEKYKTTMLRALNEMASFTLSTKGIPYDNVRRLLEGTLKMAGDKEEPKKTTTTIKPPSSKPPGYLKPTGTPPSGTPPGGIKKPAGKPPGY